MERHRWIQGSSVMRGGGACGDTGGATAWPQHRSNSAVVTMVAVVAAQQCDSGGSAAATQGRLQHGGSAHRDGSGSLAAAQRWRQCGGGSATAAQWQRQLGESVAVAVQ